MFTPAGPKLTFLKRTEKDEKYAIVYRLQCKKVYKLACKRVERNKAPRNSMRAQPWCNIQSAMSSISQTEYS